MNKKLFWGFGCLFLFLFFAVLTATAFANPLPVVPEDYKFVKNQAEQGMEKIKDILDAEKILSEEKADSDAPKETKDNVGLETSILDAGKKDDQAGNKNGEQKLIKNKKALPLPKNKDIAKQILSLAAAQEGDQKELENKLPVLEKRNKALKFLVGPNYGTINSLEKRLRARTSQIEHLTELKDKIADQADKAAIENHIETLKNVRDEIQSRLDEFKKGFSLFGWLNNLINR